MKALIAQLSALQRQSTGLRNQRATHRIAQSALSSAFMVKNVFKIQGGLDLSKISGVGASFGLLLVHIPTGQKKQRACGKV
jgi:hypothetical protein